MRDALPVAALPDEAPAAAAAPRPVYLYPGEIFVSAEPALVTTVLGSCVAVCVADVSRRIGGMNHFLLPHDAGAAAAGGRFGPAATAELLLRLESLGARRGTLVAKVFGGSCVLHGAPIANAIGAKNVRVALRCLEEAGVPVAAADTGGARGRKLLYRTDTGLASVRLL